MRNLLLVLLLLAASPTFAGEAENTQAALDELQVAIDAAEAMEAARPSADASIEEKREFINKLLLRQCWVFAKTFQAQATIEEDPERAASAALAAEGLDYHCRRTEAIFKAAGLFRQGSYLKVSTLRKALASCQEDLQELFRLAERQDENFEEMKALCEETVDGLERMIHRR